MRRSEVQLAQAGFEMLKFRGGLDIMTPPYQASPEMLRDALNFEVGVEDGYDRIVGYERFDGQAKPSDAQYYILSCIFSDVISVGDTVTGATSGDTGEVIAVTADYIVMTKVTGVFQDGENLEVSSVVKAVADGIAAIAAGATAKLRAQYANLAADVYRDDIAAVPGSGRVRGLWMLNDVKYAFRNNAGGTACDLYKSSAGGWVQVALGYELEFSSGGTYVPQEGDSILGESSGATATIARVVLEDGDWSTGDATGRLIFASQTGVFQAEDLTIDGNVGAMTIAADSDAITLLPDGDFEFDTYNFGGLSGEDRIYGADGVNRGFEFDGTTFVPINTGMTNDAPSHVKAHKNHLFFSFLGSAQHSSIGNPYQWSPVTGAGEIAVGGNITAFHTEGGSEGNAALGIFTKNSSHILYGTSSSDWNLVPYRDEVGAAKHTVQQMAYSLMLDDRGLLELRVSDVFGNFQHSTLTQRIQSWIIAQKPKATTSCIVRDKNQYRLFFTDGYGVYVTFKGDQVIGMIPVLFPDPVRCMFSLENSSGEEEIFFGSDDGYVYQMEKGTSFDGDSIQAFLELHYFFAGHPRRNKSWKSCALEVRGSGYAEIAFSYVLGYNAEHVHQPGAVVSPVNFSSGSWDTGNWDTGYWDGKTLLPSYFRLSGRAENISLVLNSSSDYFSPIKISGAVLRYLMGRELR